MTAHSVAHVYGRLAHPCLPSNRTLLDAESMCEDMLLAFRELRLSRVRVYAMAESECLSLCGLDTTMAD